MRFLIALALLFVPQAADDAWKAGLAEVKITPDEPIHLAGYASRTKPFEKVTADLYAKALALEDAGGNRAVLVTSDLIGFRAAVAEPICDRIREKTGLKREQILLNSSHTHTGPALSLDAQARPPFTEDDARKTVEYTKRLQDRVVAVVEQALGRLAPARLSWSTGVAHFVMNRREFTPNGVILGVNPRGPADRSVPVLRVAAPDGALKGVVFGYSCHNTTLGGNIYEVSGDYAGFAQEQVQQKLPGVQAMFVLGCAGDANPYPRGAMEISRQHGAALAQEVLRVLETKLAPIRGPLKVALERPALPLEEAPSAEELEKLAPKAPSYRKGVLEQQLAAHKRGDKPATQYVAPVALWQFGDDLTLVGLSGEVVVDYVQVVEQAIGPLRLWVAAYCNDVFGYLPSARVIREGGYETRGVYYGGGGFFAPAAQDVVGRTVRSLAEKTGRKLP